MRYYLDTEFNEFGYARIDLISIGLVCEDGREFYAVAGDGWDPKDCNAWVRDNVLPFLRKDGAKINPSILKNRILWYVDGGDKEAQTELCEITLLPIMSREEIAAGLLEFIHPPLPPSTPPVVPGVRYSADVFIRNDKYIEFWGYFSDYDWVLFCQLFGTMMQLPKGFPMFCLDLKQEMHRLGISREELPPQEGIEHNALADARYLREVHKFLIAAAEQQRNDLRAPFGGGWNI